MKIDIQELIARPTAGIRAHTSMATIGDDVGRVTRELIDIVGDRAAGPVVARYLSWEGDAGEFEAAVPVSEPLQDERVISGELPAGRAVVGEHVGPYPGLAAAWGLTRAWIAEHRLETNAPPWEEYVSDCRDVPPRELVTLIVFPIA